MFICLGTSGTSQYIHGGSEEINQIPVEVYCARKNNVKILCYHLTLICLKCTVGLHGINVIEILQLTAATDIKQSGEQ